MFKSFLNKRFGGIIILTYLVYSIQFLRTIWLSGFSKDVLIEFQILSLVLKFSPIFFLGFENYIFMQLSRAKSYLDKQIELKLIFFGIFFLFLISFLVGYYEEVNFLIYGFYLISLPLLTVIKIRLRLRDKNEEILIVEFIIAILIWLGLYFKFSLVFTLNFVGIFSILYYLFRKKITSDKNLIEINFNFSKNLRMMLASNYSLFFIQFSLFASKAVMPIKIWSDFALSLLIAQGMWYGFGGINWFLQPKMWSSNLKQIDNYQYVFSITSIIYFLICLLFTLIILSYVDVSEYIINYYFIPWILISLLSINMISPFYSYLIKMERFNILIIISVISILIFVFGNYFSIKIYYSMILSSFSYSLLIAVYKNYMYEN